MPTKTKVKGFEVLVPQLTVHREVTVLRDTDGSVVGRQNGRGKTYFLGEVIPIDEVSPDYREALEDPDHPTHDVVSKKLKPVGNEPYEDTKLRLGIPFEGYEDMDEDEIISAMRHLPSPAIQRIKQFESQNENRFSIVNYNISTGESPNDRAEGRVGSEVAEPDDDKEAANISTREVPDSGPVIPGEGITGTGDPQVEPGSSKEKARKPANLKGARDRAASRRGRRERQTEESSDDKSDSDSND